MIENREKTVMVELSEISAVTIMDISGFISVMGKPIKDLKAQIRIYLKDGESISFSLYTNEDEAREDYHHIVSLKDALLGGNKIIHLGQLE